MTDDRNARALPGSDLLSRRVGRTWPADWPEPEDVDAGRVLGNLLVLGRELRWSGLPLGTGQILSLVEAMAAINPARRSDVYWAARSSVVTRPEHIPIFDAAFGRFWRRLADAGEFSADGFLQAVSSMDIPAPPTLDETGRKREKKERGQGATGAERERTMLVIEGTDDADVADDAEELSASPEDVLLFSAREALRKKDFSELTPTEIAEARQIINAMTWRLGKRETRRRIRANDGPYIDQRATMRNSLRHGGVPIELRRRRRKERMRPLVLICDISSSMDRYTRLLLRFVHALEHGLDATEVFVFGTRLTRITRQLRRRDVDGAIADVVNAVDDWSGGTRIGEAIKDFNYRWSRRVLRSGATVVVISDGWDRGDPALLGMEMARLQRSCRRLIWLNPLLGSPGYQPLTQGMRAALPFTDYFLPVHNLESMAALAALLGSVDDQPPARRTWGGKVSPTAA